MLADTQVEQLIELIGSLDRISLIRLFCDYEAPFPVDFTADFLETMPLDRLRHLMLALCLQCQRLPEIPAETAA